MNDLMIRNEKKGEKTNGRKDLLGVYYYNVHSLSLSLGGRLTWFVCVSAYGGFIINECGDVVMFV